ncbi:unnamed protein product [Rotaria socialis]|uniref:RRM domain-containing protein n=1 Tax=Rotaria socialis TaxID=392032 RepID=A0A820MC42_9BILA|nr:unnamed protein product [Rotaria socialis]CAF4159991.1 unnamed protein product [Rotaria socialis]CAF4372303.1 unnamed protein product [Rotaria socialis]
MPRNVEIKASIDDHINNIIERIRPFADGPPRYFTQNDTFFNCPSGGRLKLRIEQDSPAQLIYYERNDIASLSIPKLSNYSIAPIMYRSTCFQWEFYDPQMSGSIDGTDLIPHDRAIDRAYQSNYKRPRCSSSFFIGHIPPSCAEHDLAQIFPNATRINLIRDIVTCEPRGYAFLDGNIDRDKEYKFNGHLLFIEDTASKNIFGWKPRRCGGGLGGKKQSGQLRFGGSQRPFKKPFHVTEQDVLSLSLGGIRGQVDKHRTLFLTGHGQTRIHIDQVKGFESTIFIELEVILRDDQTPEHGQLIAKELCEKIGIQEENHIKCAYIDLLLKKDSQNDCH